jgi:hypothetical protein
MANNQTKTSVLYPQRLYYKYNFFNDVENKIDFWSQRKYYGLLDHNGTPVYLNKQFLKTISMPSTTNTSVRQTTINFVSDSFKQMITDLKTAEPYLNLPKSNYNPLNIKKSTLLFETEYKNYMTNLLNIFYSGIKTEYDSSVISFKDFLKLFINYMVDSERYVITQSAFLTSYYSSPLLTGLVIEFSDKPHDDDSIKINNFIYDPNFTFFCDTMGKYSFMVDKNAPWRVVYNLGTEFAKEKMSAYGITSLEDMFSKYYVYPHLTEYEEIKKQLIKFYLKNTKEQITKSTYCSVKKALTFEVIQTKRDTDMDEVFWIQLYYYIRCKEEKIEMHQSQFNKNLSRITTMYNSLGKTYTLEWILSETKKFIDGGTNPSYIQYRTISKRKLDNTTPYSFVL